MMERIKNKLKTKIKTAIDEATDLEKCLSDKDYMIKKFGEKKVNAKRNIDILEIDRTELIRSMRALSKEEWEIVINEAPVELCHERIGRELKEAGEFRKSVGAAVEGIKPEDVW